MLPAQPPQRPAVGHAHGDGPGAVLGGSSASVGRGGPTPSRSSPDAARHRPTAGRPRPGRASSARAACPARRSTPRSGPARRRSARPRSGARRGRRPARRGAPRRRAPARTARQYPPTAGTATTAPPPARPRTAVAPAPTSGGRCGVSSSSAPCGRRPWSLIRPHALFPAANPCRPAPGAARPGPVRPAPRRTRVAGPDAAAASAWCGASSTTTAPGRPQPEPGLFEHGLHVGQPGVPSLAGPATRACRGSARTSAASPATPPRSHRAGSTRPGRRGRAGARAAARASSPRPARRGGRPRRRWRAAHAPRGWPRPPPARRRWRRWPTPRAPPGAELGRQGQRDGAAARCRRRPPRGPRRDAAASQAPGLGQRHLDHLLGLGPRNQHPRVDAQVERAEGPVPEDVLQRLPRRPAGRHGPRRGHGRPAPSGPVGGRRRARRQHRAPRRR